MIKRHFLSPAALLGAALFAFFSLPLRPVRAQNAVSSLTAPTRPFEGIIVQGTGEVRVKPDIARLNLGVQTQDKDVRRASGDNATRTQALIAALRGAGVQERDIQTAGFSISPQYDDRPRPDANTSGPQQPVLIGYMVSNEVRVVVRHIETADGVLDAAIRAGANTASGISFDLNDALPSRDEALRRAVADANRKARVLSEAAETGPVRLVALVEGSSEAPPRPFVTFARAAGTGATTPVEAGEIVLTASITAYYATQTR